MTIQEYSTLMGYEETCPMEEYETADFIYMMAGNMDKQTFCKEYKKIGSNPLVLTLANVSNNFQKAYREKQTKETDTAHTLLKQAAQIRKGIMSNEAAADSIDGTATRLISTSDSIKYKIEHKLPLSVFDLTFISENLR